MRNTLIIHFPTKHVQSYIFLQSQTMGIVKNRVIFLLVKTCCITMLSITITTTIIINKPNKAS